jgi:hypothetical protein
VTHVKTLGEVSRKEMTGLLERLDLRLHLLNPGASLPGSYWGEPEAGLVGVHLYAREDTPIHSILHEASHFVCMSAARRARLDRDAGGNDLEESAACYLQILLSDFVSGIGRGRMFHDMDAWGYSFRLGSTREWFRSDADDARLWLVDQGILGAGGAPTWSLRQET